MATQRMFSLEETAVALQISVKTLNRRVARGEIRTFRRGGEWWISPESIRKWIFRRLAIHVRPSSYSKTKLSGLKSEQIRGQLTSLSRFRYRATATTPPTRGKVSSPDVAVSALQNSFRYFARRYATGNPPLQDDLVQEMSVAVLLCAAPANRAFFLERAKSRALDYLDREALRGMVSLSEIKRHPAATEPIRDPALLHVLKMAGIPVALLLRELGIVVSPEAELD